AHTDASVARACRSYDARLGSPSGDKRAPMFEACVRLAARGSVGPIAGARLRETSQLLAASELQLRLLRTASASIFPRRVDDSIGEASRRMTLLERGHLDGALSRDPRELAQAIARVERSTDASAANGAKLATMMADIARLLTQGGAL